jgi:hypothetical protein
MGSDDTMAHNPPDNPDLHNDQDEKGVPATVIPVPIAPPLTANPLQVDNWVDYIPTTDHVEFFKSREWGKTPVGELRTWGFALRLHVFMVLADSRAACLYWLVHPFSFNPSEYLKLSFPMDLSLQPSLLLSTLCNIRISAIPRRTN